MVLYTAGMCSQVYCFAPFAVSFEHDTSLEMPLRYHCLYRWLVSATLEVLCHAHTLLRELLLPRVAVRKLL